MKCSVEGKVAVLGGTGVEPREADAHLVGIGRDVEPRKLFLFKSLEKPVPDCLVGAPAGRCIEGKRRRLARRHVGRQRVERPALDFLCTLRPRLDSLLLRAQWRESKGGIDLIVGVRCDPSPGYRGYA